MKRWPGNGVAVEGLEPSVTTNSPEFLVVEDHPMVMRTLRTYLQRVGTVLEAGTVQEGLRVFEEHTNLAGMLVDVNLPDGLGTDLIREIRRRDPVLPILMLTSRVPLRFKPSLFLPLELSGLRFGQQFSRNLGQRLTPELLQRPLQFRAN